MEGSSFAFEIDETVELSYYLRIATVAAGVATDAHIVAVQRENNMLRLTFDKEISQSLIVYMLELILSVRTDPKPLNIH